MIRIPGSSGFLILAFVIAACGKNAADTAAAETAVSATPAAEPADPSAATPAAQEGTADTTELARKKALLAYSMMEDSYIGDASGQWASAIRVSSTFGDKPGDPVVDSTNSNSSYGVRGAPDSRSWSNNNQTLGTDWLEATFARPVSATEVRIVSTKSPQAIAKIELIDVGGTSHTVWSGVNEDPDETRGPRTWVIRKFAATPYQVKAVKITIANALVQNYKELDAVQLIGK